MKRLIRSFVRRGRMTSAQRQALDNLGPAFQLQLDQGLCDFSRIFQREAAINIEIGFGSGHSLLAAAKQHPEKNFIGIETHQPGIGTLLQHILLEKMENVRFFHADAVEVLKQCIPDQSIDAIQIFFPDPWPKRRHHKRRLIQTEFVSLMAGKLKLGGTLHLATDWEPYTMQMMRVLSSHPSLKNQMGEGSFADRSTLRPVVTKFENRGKTSGRKIWELRFQRVF